MKHRVEKDLLGEVKIPVGEYTGVHYARAILNFGYSTKPVSAVLVKSLVNVKLACAETNYELGYIKEDVFNAVRKACELYISGEFKVDVSINALQGGAGTSLNMTVNEIIANKALEILGAEKGNYSVINPNDTINLHQSTNDVFPTAVKICIFELIRKASTAVESLQCEFQKKEKEFASVLTIGRTEMQAAVPLTLGNIFSAYSEAFARDRWRLFKSEERIKRVNLGGTAIGSGMCAPRKYIFLVTEKLRALTGLGIARAENGFDQTSNADMYVEVSGMMKAFAVNVLKICDDLRKMHLNGEVNVAPAQTGSSIMPGKVNPVILEYAIQTAIKIKANDFAVGEAAARGTHQINEFLPLIAESMIESLELIIDSSTRLAKCVSGISCNEDRCRELFEKSESLLTVFVPEVGYAKSSELYAEYKESGKKTVLDFLKDKFGEEKVAQLLTPGNITALGFK